MPVLQNWLFYPDPDMESLTLLHLSIKNVQDDIFLKDLSSGFSWKQPVLLVHDSPYASPEDTRFLTKRISGHFSEALVANVAFSGDQRNLLQTENGVVNIRIDLMQQMYRMAPVLILNSLLANTGYIPAQTLTRGLKAQLNPAEIVLFPDNPLSPLASAMERLESADRVQQLLNLYPEESSVLTLASELLPVSIRKAKEYPNAAQK
jgi:hypothetical protein